VQLVGRTGNLNAVATPVPVGVIPPPMPAPGQPYFGARRFPELGDIVFVTNLGDSVYHGGPLEVERRFGLRLGIHGSYTFSKAISHGGARSMGSLSDLPVT